MKCLSSIGVVFVTALILGGCLRSMPIGSQQVVRAPGTEFIEVITLRSAEKDGFLTAHVTLKNRGSNQQAAYRFVWLASDELQLTKDAWKPIFIAPGMQETVEALSPSRLASDFQFELVLQKKFR